MKLFHILGTLVLLALSPAVPALAAEQCDFCTALDTGVGSSPGKPTSCLVEITAPTYGGEAALDIRDKDGKSIWPKPRIKQVASGTLVYRIGCSQVQSPTDQVYLCIDGRKGGDGKTYHSSRFRAEGSLDLSLKTHKLEMCLKDKLCPKWHAKEPEKVTAKEEWTL